VADVSPLQVYCERMDKAYSNLGFMGIYENIIPTINVDYFTKLWLSEISFRASHQQNFLILIEGAQASGKSLFANDNSIRIGQAFGVPFKLERDIFANPFDLDRELRKGENRRTYLYDEIPKRRAGKGSASVERSIDDWEEIARYSQKNVIKCSPEVFDENPYFWFRQIDYQIERIKNAKCDACDAYVECNREFYSTLCEKGVKPHKVSFYERSGYPKYFQFLLMTKRLADKQLVPRGIVRLPMIDHKTALRYDAVKKKNIDAFENYLNKAWDKKSEEVEAFIDEYFEKLTRYKQLKDRKIIVPEG